MRYSIALPEEICDWYLFPAGTRKILPRAGCPVPSGWNEFCQNSGLELLVRRLRENQSVDVDRRLELLAIVLLPYPIGRGRISLYIYIFERYSQLAQVFECPRCERAPVCPVNLYFLHTNAIAIGQPQCSAGVPAGTVA